jgi:hypothetical protein
VVSGARRHVVRRGQALLIPPFTLHRYEALDGARHPLAFLGFESDVGDDATDAVALQGLDAGCKHDAFVANSLSLLAPAAQAEQSGVEKSCCGFHHVFNAPNENLFCASLHGGWISVTMRRPFVNKVLWNCIVHLAFQNPSGCVKSFIFNDFMLGMVL